MGLATVRCQEAAQGEALYLSSGIKQLGGQAGEDPVTKRWQVQKGHRPIPRTFSSSEQEAGVEGAGSPFSDRNPDGQKEGVPAPGLRPEFLRSPAAWKTQGRFLFPAPPEMPGPQQEGDPAGQEGEPWQGLGCKHRAVYRGKPGQRGCPFPGVPGHHPLSTRWAHGDTIFRRNWELEAAARTGGCVCQLCWLLGMRRGSELAGVPAKEPFWVQSEPAPSTTE